MSSGSVRMHVPIDHHFHDDPPEGESPGAAIPDSKAEADPVPKESPSGVRLWRDGGRVMFQSADGGDPVPARVVWARPLSERGGPISVLVAGKKKELAYIPAPELLSESSRRVALEELDGGVILPRILEIKRVRPRFGNYYWDVVTDRGEKRFLLSAPENNSFRPKPDVLVIKDVSGNCYEINPVSKLDRDSLRELDRVL